MCEDSVSFNYAVLCIICDENTGSLYHDNQSEKRRLSLGNFQLHYVDIAKVVKQ